MRPADLRRDRAARWWRNAARGALAALALAGCGGDATGPGAPGPGADPEVTEFVQAMNVHRVTVGCAPLAWHAGVAGVAEAHSKDMVDRDFFSHTNPDGESPFDRLAAAGVTWSGGAGENIAYGTSDGTVVLGLWLDSPGHRANIENCGYTHHGVGLVSGHWTHLFVTNPN